jgi:hypothetical protein
MMNLLDAVYRLHGATVLPDFSLIDDPLERSGAITWRPLADDHTIMHLGTPTASVAFDLDAARRPLPPRAVHPARGGIQIRPLAVYVSRLTGSSDAEP